MTDVLIGRDEDTDTYRGTTLRGPREKAASTRPGGRWTGNQPLQHLDRGPSHPRPGENEFLLYTQSVYFAK